MGGPPFYCALADLGNRPTTSQCPAGGCGAKGGTTGQNTLFIDPDFGTLGVRASDANTAAMYIPGTVRSFHGSANESEGRGWNADGTKFYSPVDGNWQATAFFNPATMHVTWILANSGAGINNHTPQATYVAWDPISPNLLYGILNSATQIWSWDFSACSDPGNVNSVTCTVTRSATPLYDFANCPGLSTHGGWESNHTSGYVSAFSMDGQTFATTLGVGAWQDVDFIDVVWNKSKGCLWLNTKTLTMGGDTDSAHWNVNGGATPGNPIAVAGYKPDPAPSNPTLSASPTGGSLPNGTYSVGVTYTNNWLGQNFDGGESLPGTGSLTLNAGTSTQTISFSAPPSPPPVDGTPPMDWAGSYGGYNVYACSGASCSPTWQPGDPTLTVSGFTVAPTCSTSCTTTYDYTIVPFSAAKMGVPVHVRITNGAARPTSGSATLNTLSWTSVSSGVTGCALILGDLTAATTTVDTLAQNINCATTIKYVDNLNTVAAGTTVKQFQLESVKQTSGTFTLGSVTTGLAPQPISTTDAPNGTMGGGIHQIVFNHDGSWLLTRSGTRIFWKLGTNTVVQCESDPSSAAGLTAYSDFAGCNGHEAFGTTFHYGRTGGTATGSLVENDLLLARSLDSAFIANPYRANFTYYPGSAAKVFPSPTLGAGNEDAHPTTEAIEKSGMIFFTSFNSLAGSYKNGYTNATSVVRALDRELYGMSTLNPPVVYRFAGDRNMGAVTYNAGINTSGQAPTCGNYWDCGFLFVSRDGKFALVFSSWDDSVGCQNNNGACSSSAVFNANGQLQSGGSGDVARIDAFVYKLQ